MNYIKTLLLVSAVFALTGCEAVDKVLMEQQTQQVVTSVSATNQDGSVITIPVTNVVLVPTGNVRPAVTTGTDLVAGLPLPYAGIIGTLLGWIATLYVAIRRKKVSVALVQGIEVMRKILQETPEGKKLDVKLLEALKTHQDVSGVLNEVSKLVNEYTSKTTSNG